MKLNLKKAILNFVYAYVIVTILAYGVSIAYGMIFKPPTHEELGVGLFEDPAFVKTVPYHLLINLLCWMGFSYLYFKNKTNSKYFLKEAVYLGGLWLLLAMLVDVVGFVLIKSPVSLTPHQFYIEYQPWISITYFIVFISPVISYYVFRLKNHFHNKKTAANKT